MKKKYRNIFDRTQISASPKFNYKKKRKKKRFSMYTSRDPFSRLQEGYSSERYERCLTKETKKGEIHTLTLTKISCEIKAIEAIRIKNRGIYTAEVKGQS